MAVKIFYVSNRCKNIFGLKLTYKYFTSKLGVKHFRYQIGVKIF